MTPAAAFEDVRELVSRYCAPYYAALFGADFVARWAGATNDRHGSRD